MSNRWRWHEFHGWCLSQGTRPLEMKPHEFLDLIFHYRGLVDPDGHEELTNLIAGTPDDEVKQEQPKIAPPSWWRGNDNATVSNMAMIEQLKRDRQMT